MRRLALLLVVAAASLSPAAADAEVLHDQLNNSASDGTGSTDYSSPAAGQADDQAADDFTVTSGQSWSVDTVRVYSSGIAATPPLTFDVRFYADAEPSAGGVPGYPGPELASKMGLQPSSHNPEVLDLGPPVVLSGGHYWVSVQANTTDVRWLWENRLVVSGLEAAWRGTTGGCMADSDNSYGWHMRSRDCTMAGGNGADQMFRLDGERDSDSDGVLDPSDGCPADADPDQADFDDDGAGDACDSPKTAITKTKVKQAKRIATFSFATEEGSTFKCALDRKKFKPCGSPQKYKGLKRGKHKFRVFAIDPDGNIDNTPAVKKFKIK